MAAELGHDPNRFYADQAGNLHLNGAKLYDSNERDVSNLLNLNQSVEVKSANGAIASKSGVVVITKGSAAALTLAAPTAGDDDGGVLRIIAGTAFAHTVTFAAGPNGGSSHVVTFGRVGDQITAVAYNGAWYLVNPAVPPLTENGSAIGGTNDGDLPDLTASVGSAVVTTAATQTTPYGFATQAQADNLVARVNALIVDNVALRAAIREVATKANAAVSQPLS